MRSSSRQLLLLLGVLVLLGGAILTLTWRSLVIPCDPARSALAITVLVDDTVRARYTLPASAAQRPPVDVGPAASVSVIAELGVWPQGCQGAFSFDWETVFVGCAPQNFRSQSEAPTRARLDLTLGPQCVRTQSEDYIVAVVRDMAGPVVQTAIIRLKGK